MHRRTAVLSLLGAVQFVVVLDTTAVGIALPSMQGDLGLSDERTQWLVSGYALTFAGFLLLGGRAADAFGRRRVFAAGLALFTAASLLCALAGGPALLLAARALQGLGGALATPAAFSLLTTTFAEGRARTFAIAVWAAAGGSAAVLGVALGGILTAALGWEAIFLVNVPVGLLVLAVTPLVLPESGAGIRAPFDVPGALLVTAGLGALVLALAQAGADGWRSPLAAGAAAAAALLLGSFAAWERRAALPLLPPALARRDLATANLAGLLHGALAVGIVLLVSLQAQAVLGFSLVETGLALVALRASAALAAAPAARLVTRAGPRPVVASGMLLTAAAFARLGELTAGAAYARDVLPALVAAGIGSAFGVVAVSVAAVRCVAPEEAGVASGLLATSQWIGYALAAAAVCAFGLAPGAETPPAEAAAGLGTAFTALAALALAGAVAALAPFARRRRRTPAPAALCDVPA
jgi:EmrB/QacA subfamily drug resistance transporter